MRRKPEILRASSPREIAAAIEVRRAVFVEEQGGPPEEEPDALDAGARHYLVVDNGVPVGAARLVAPSPEVCRIGRVCILPSHRGGGWGEALMRFLLAEAEAAGAAEVLLDAQVPVIPFYERLGFRAEGDVFLDAGIPHRRMRRSLER